MPDQTMATTPQSSHSDPASLPRTSVAILAATDGPTPHGLQLDYDDAHIHALNHPVDTGALAGLDRLVVQVPAGATDAWATPLRDATTSCTNGTTVMLVAPHHGTVTTSDAASSLQVPLADMHLVPLGETFALAGTVDDQAEMMTDELAANLQLIAQVQRAAVATHTDHDDGKDEVVRLAGELALTQQRLRQAETELAASPGVKFRRSVAALRESIAQDDDGRALFARTLRARRHLKAQYGPTINKARRAARSNRTLLALAVAGTVGVAGLVVADLEDPRTLVALEAGQLGATGLLMLGVRTLMRRGVASERRITARLDTIRNRQYSTAAAGLAADADLQGQLERLSATLRHLSLPDATLKAATPPD